MKKTDKYFIYFYYNNNDELLYIGKAIDVGARWNGHIESWKQEVAKVGVILCPDQAAMDLLENYFITKMPTKYNKAGLSHGYTTFTIPNLPQQTIYTLQEFKNTYIKDISVKKKTYPPMEERIKELGIEIIDVGPQFNIMDYLERDLDKACFRYENMYLISRYTYKKIPNTFHERPSKSENCDHRTNNAVLCIKRYLEIPNKIVTVHQEAPTEDAMIVTGFTTDQTGYEAVDCMLKNLDYMYHFYEVKSYRGHEVMGSIRCYHRNRFCSLMGKHTSEGYVLELKQYQLPELPYRPNYIIGTSLIYDFEKAKIFKKKIEELEGEKDYEIL